MSKAWDFINTETLSHLFLVCGISNAFDGSQENLMSDDLPLLEVDSEGEETVVMVVMMSRLKLLKN